MVVEQSSSAGAEFAVVVICVVLTFLTACLSICLAGWYVWWVVGGGWCPPTCVEGGLVLPSPCVSPRLVLYPVLSCARTATQPCFSGEGREGSGVESVSRVSREEERGGSAC